MDNGIYSQKLKAGKRRTYFFDVRTTKSNDYYITITESKKRFDDDGYDRHKLFLYKEDFNKFVSALSNTVDYIKSDLMPDYDFEEFDREPEEMFNNQNSDGAIEEIVTIDDNTSEEKNPGLDISIDEDLSF